MRIHLTVITTTTSTIELTLPFIIKYIQANLQQKQKNTARSIYLCASYVIYFHYFIKFQIRLAKKTIRNK